MSRAKRVPSLLAAVSLLASALAGATAPAAAQTTPPTCIAETEPNDTADTGLAIGPGCFSGTLPDNDQDLYTWDVTPELAAQRWTISLHGVPGTLTGLQMLAITSDPGVTPILAGPKLLELDMPVHPTAPSVDSNIFIPAGRYIVGVSRSTTPDGGTPTIIDYSFSVQPGDPVPASGDTEPNDDAATAGKVHGAFAISGDLGGSADQYAWTLSAEDAAQGLGSERPGPGRRRRHHAAVGLGRHAAGLRVRGHRWGRHRLRPAPAQPGRTTSTSARWVMAAIHTSCRRPRAASPTPTPSPTTMSATPCRSIRQRPPCEGGWPATATGTSTG